LIVDSLIDCKEDPRGKPQANARQDPASIRFRCILYFVEVPKTTTLNLCTKPSLKVRRLSALGESLWEVILLRSPNYDLTSHRELALESVFTFTDPD
jgi:hypothetical protein